MNKISVLQKIGLSDKEIKVYLNLLEYGSSSVRIIAELTNLNRGTVYDILKKLREMNLVSYYHKETKQKFIAEDPGQVLQILKEKESEFRNIKQKAEEIIPELKSLQEKKGQIPTTKLYEGKKGIKFILNDVLSSVFLEESKEYYVYSAKRSSEDINKAFPSFTKERIKKGIRVKAISLAKGGKTSGLDERRWLGSNDETATFIIIYSGKSSFISRDAKGEPIGVIIENEMIYNTQKTIFLRLWNLLK